MGLLEILVVVAFLALLIGLIAAPFLLFWAIKKWYRLKFDFLFYLIAGIIIAAALTLLLAWWADASGGLLMRYYGYDFDALTAAERYSHVKAEHFSKVYQLEISRSGLGWPVKAILGFVLFVPYLVLIYVATQLVRNAQRKKKKPAPDIGE